MKIKVLIFLSSLVLLFQLTSSPAYADPCSDCLNQKKSFDQCRAVCQTGAPAAPQGPAGIFGRVEPPPGVTAHGEDPRTGVVNFLNTILRLLVVVGGLWALFNIIIAGYQFMSAGGDPKAIASAWGRIWQTLLGLVLVAGSFLLAAVIGQLLFGKPDAILRPELIGPKTP